MKRLKARPSPPRFGRKLTAAQKARATHICLDCGFIYFQARRISLLRNPARMQASAVCLLSSTAHVYPLLTWHCAAAAQAADFDELPGSYECPQCAAPKSRFAGYDAETGRTTGKGASGAPQIVNIVGAIGLVGIIALVVVGLQ